MTTLVFVQARMGSTRLPGKVLEPIASKPLLGRVIERLGAARGIDEIAILIPDSARDAPLRRVAGEAGVELFAGSEDDVLDRFHAAALELEPELIVRVTADCPLLDPELVSAVIDLYRQGDVDYACVATTPASGRRRFPDGLDAEVFSAATLATVWSEARDPADREHVTSFIWRHSERFRLAMLEAEQDWGDERWTVDYPEDLEFVRAVYERLDRPGEVFGHREILDLLAREPGLRELNAMHAGYDAAAEAGLRPTRDA